MVDTEELRHRLQKEPERAREHHGRMPLLPMLRDGLDATRREPRADIPREAVRPELLHLRGVLTAEIGAMPPDALRDARRRRAEMAECEPRSEQRLPHAEFALLPE